MANTFEVVIDNAKIQVHCHDEEPPATTLFIDVPLTRGRIQRTEEDGSSTDEFHDYPGSWPEVMAYNRWTDPTYTHLGGTVLNPIDWDGITIGGSNGFVPDTPDGYSLTEIRFILKAHMTGGAPDVITEDTSSWGYLPAPTKSPYFADVHSGTGRVFDDFPTSEPSDWIECGEPFSLANEHFASQWRLNKWFAVIPSPPYPAEPRAIVLNGMGLRFVYDPI